MVRRRIVVSAALVVLASLTLAALALAESVTLSGEVKGDTLQSTGRIGLIFKLDKDGRPSKLLSGSYNNIDTTCPGGGRTQALGPIGSAKVKKEGSKLTFKWKGDSGPSGTAEIEGVISKSGSKASGTFGQSYNAGTTTAPFVCVSNNIEFTIKAE